MAGSANGRTGATSGAPPQPDPHAWPGEHRGLSAMRAPAVAASVVPGSPPPRETG